MKYGIWVVVAFGLVLFLVCGLKDIGVSFDERMQVAYGNVAWNYIFHGNPRLIDYSEKYHGVIWEVVLVGVQKLLHIETWRGIFQLRHLLNFFLFIFGGVLFSQIMSTRFSKVAIWSFLVWLLSPRQFAHAVMNTKDIPLMVFFVLWAWVFSTVKKHRWVYMAIVTALATSTRLIGGVLLFPVLFEILLKNSLSRREKLRHILLTLLIFSLATILFWPILWENPFAHFLGALQEAKQFPWLGTVLFCGDFLKSTALPWTYIPVWMGITIPIPYLILFAVGLAKLIRNFKRGEATKLDIVALYLLLAPFLLVIILKPILYDGWRHLYFIYPFFIYFTIWGGVSLYEWANRYQKWVLISFTFVLGFIGFRMMQLHPYQMVYFNRLAGDPYHLRMMFEQDYWGTSFKEGLEYIANQTQEPVTVWAQYEPVMLNKLALPDALQKKIVLVDNPEDASFFVTNFRWHPEEYPFEEIYRVYRQKTKLLSVYKLPSE